VRWKKHMVGCFVDRRCENRDSVTLDGLGLEGGWICVMDGGRLDTGVAKGKELAVVWRAAAVKITSNNVFAFFMRVCRRSHRNKI
jgi:hypothetical protein